MSLALKGEIDFLQGRNEELRAQLAQLKTELTHSQTSLIKSQDEVERLSSDVRQMNLHSSAKDILQPLPLSAAGMAPSSQDIISALNEYLIDTLQELDEFRRVSALSERELEALKRKYAVARHQVCSHFDD